MAAIEEVRLKGKCGIVPKVETWNMCWGIGNMQR